MYNARRRVRELFRIGSLIITETHYKKIKTEPTPLQYNIRQKNS